MNAKKILVYFLAILVCVIFTLPTFWILSSSFKVLGEVLTKEITWWPWPMHFENYRDLQHIQRWPMIEIPAMTNYFRNSVIVASVTTVLSILLGIMTGYSIQRFRTGGTTIAGWLLGQRFLPPVVLVIPISQVFQTLKLIDTVYGLILGNLIFAVPFAAWLIATYFKAIPRELDEAAAIDGYSRWGTLFRILLPPMLPAIGAVAALVFVSSWNEFIFALILTNSENARTIPVFMAMFHGKHLIPIHVMSAAAVIGIIPSLVLFILIQKYLVTGLSMGAVKGVARA